MEKVFEWGEGAARIRVVVELPELPDGVKVEAELNVRAKSEEDALASIEAFGGIGAFLLPSGAFAGGDTTTWLRPRGADYGADLEITLAIPTGRDRPVPEAPFLAELREQHDRAQSQERREEAARGVEAAQDEVRADG